MRKINLSLNLNGENKKYLLIANAVKERIQNKTLSQGEILPSSRELAYELNTNRHTIMRAMDELISEGYLESHQKRHYIVAKVLPDEIIKIKELKKENRNTEIDFKIINEVDLPEYTLHSTDYKYSFGSGRPDLRLFPMKQFKSHLYDSINRLGIKGLGYSHPQGHFPLIQALQKYLEKIRLIKDKEIIVTHGFQEAIFTLSKMFIQKNDNVIVEELGYAPAFEALKSAGANLIKTKVDENGIIVDEIENEIKKGKKVKAIYITPLHQFPTTVTLSLERRLKLYELCVKNKIIILEDDYDHEYHYKGQSLPPLASIDTAGIVMYISTLSKLVFPASRIGIAAIPGKYVSQFSKNIQISSRQNNVIFQDAIRRMIVSGDFERHLLKTRNAYHKRRDTLIKELGKYKTKYNIRYKIPDGGLAVWCEFSCSNEKFFKIKENAEKHKIFIREFSERKNSLRIEFSYHNESEISEGIKLLFS